MPHPLEQRLAAVRRRVRRLAAVYGLSWVIGSVLVVVLLVGGADYLIRFQDRGIRVIASLAVLGVLGWSFYRHFIETLARPLGNVELARRVERRFPALGDSLASAVEFLHQGEDEPTAGSVALRRAVITGATAETERLDFQEAVRPRPARRAALAAVAVVLVAAAVVLLAPVSSGIALARLANPFWDVAFPQKTHLKLVRRVDKVARGQAFEIEVIDRDGVRLPAEVFVHYRIQGEDGSITAETSRMQFLQGAMTARRENVTRPFSYFVEGGDDHFMKPIDVEVLEPPALEQVSIKLFPPDYTGWPPQGSEQHVRALVGTRVEITARANKPLESAFLAIEDDRRVAGQLSDGGLRVAFPAPGEEPWLVEASGGYWFELTDTEGLSGGTDDRWSVRAVPDTPPSVTVEEPAANLLVTPRAVVPLRVTAKDDLAVHRVDLHYELPGGEEAAPPAAIELWAGPEKAAPPVGGLDAIDSGDKQVVADRWDLGPLGLQPGTTVTFTVAADDYLPQTGTSDPRRLTVITPEELADQIASRQGFILSELARVLQIEEQCRAQVAKQQIQLEEKGRLEQVDVDRLRGTELNQRQVERTLTSPADGVPAHIHSVLSDLANNGLASPDVRGRMEELLAELERLGRDHLPVIGRELTSGVKAAQVWLDEHPDEAPDEKPLEPDRAIVGPLSTAGDHQDAVIDSLERLLGELSRWDSFRRFQRELTQLARDQDDLTRRTAELAARTLTRELKSLSPDEIAGLRVTAREQLDLARHLDRILQGMEKAVDELGTSDPMAAETVSDALLTARELAISPAMRTASGHVEGNRMGQGIGLQKQIRQHLQEVLDVLANRRETELAGLVRKLREAEKDLADLARRQEGLKKKAEAARTQADRAEQTRRLQQLQKEQQELADEAERTARRLQRLTADRASQQTSEAAEKMRGACSAAAKGDADKTTEQADEATKKLEKAVEELRRRRQQAEAELAMEQLAKLEDALRTMRGRQDKALAETVRLEELAQSQGRLTRGQQATLQDLAREQKLLETDTRGMAEKLSGAAVFQLAFSATAGDMVVAAGRLQREMTDEPTQSAQRRALAGLDQLLAALQPEKPEPGEDGNSGGGNGPGQGNNMSPAAALQALAELKLLKLMQQDVNRRTKAIEEQFGPLEQLPDEARREYDELAREQGRLADLMLNLVPESPDPEDNPAALPDVPGPVDEEEEP